MSLTNATTNFLSSTPSDYQYGASQYRKDASGTLKLESKIRQLKDKCERVEQEVAEIEVKMNLERRWIISDEPYQETLKYLVERKYQRALAHLEKLVVQRLSELHKMNLANSGTHLTYVYCKYTSTLTNDFRVQCSHTFGKSASSPFQSCSSSGEAIQ